ncbi:hypothetical protein [Flavobacterium psychrotrophum]|uniref:hypothetical protein n=1 Tax=Flavobacterium psychrotrophum TaxID=2294119 RepID=UPI000E31010C|nr:hypothetical protein [Flavobacterium psychrotrophum]
MLTRLFIILFCLSSAFAKSQEKEKQQILAEAWLLYNSERASWHGTDIFTERYPALRKKMSGYFSYTEGDEHKCVFYDQANPPKTLAIITFNNNFVLETAKVDTTARILTKYETDLCSIREKVTQEVYKDTTLFKHYKNTSYNLVPLIVNNKKKVYIFTGPGNTGQVIFGNDYLIEFDKKNVIKSKKALHKSIIPINYAKEGQEVTTMHTHLPSSGDLITATDICTLLLYAPYANWSQHYVISQEYVSIWECEKENLFIMTRKAWDKISEADSKGNKK